ncbi:MAG: hypothetical protein KME20_11210 [Kaiparowitsia implicata GSE-PSE-MK54-09C]|jgi:uncharacterized membrane protein (UPF0136 family)|nr:hypothetical protein [Kaiparowitsia implicata GSE-PSE-MK54-09C]
MVGIIAAIAYGLLTLIGGIVGYVQAQSVPSLVSGLVSGVLLLLCALLWIRGASWAAGGAIAITLLLVVVFIVRYAKTRKPMPALLMIGAGVAAAIAMLAG